MNTPKHTPGPWVADFGGTIGHVKSTAERDDGKTPTVCRYDFAAQSIPSEERRANGLLMAAAPDLLAACKRLDDLDWILGYDMTPENFGVVQDALDLARDAIRKAEGGAK